MLKKIKQTINLLKNKKMDLSVAESCTGGMLAQRITSVSGASKIFKFGIITYSNQSKIKYLKVPSKIINKYGSVSKQCCKSMVHNLSKISKAHLNLAITGIAGPKGGSRLKPVGLVYIGIKKGNKTKIKEFIFKNKKRENIRICSVKKSLELIRSFI
ncbi:CinA family protein [Pelagibacteraceae bacterium]|nr:CinA family protein [Pelagibacteraceae bacterium]MDC0426842.1 CinA family protein [Pelagibacteraceae bacterium]